MKPPLAYLDRTFRPYDKNKETDWKTVYSAHILSPNWCFCLPQTVVTNLHCVRNPVKLEIRSFVMNFNSRGFSLRVLYCVVDTGYGLGRPLGDFRPTLTKGQKYQMVKTKTESHDRRPIVWTNRWQIWVSFSFEVCLGMAGICHAGLWGFSEAL